MNFAEALERGPSRSFGNGDVGIVGDKTLAVGRVDDADGESSGEKREKGGDFVLIERENPVVSGDDGKNGSEGIAFAQGGIGAGDGEFADEQAAMHVAKVDDAQNPLRLRPGWRNQDVIVVGVAVDDASTHFGKTGQSFEFEQIEEAGGQFPSSGVLHNEEIVASP